MHCHARGFTLIELLVTTAIVGILAATAYPSFQGPVYRARRMDGIAALMQLQLAQDRWRATHSSYAAQGELASAASSASGYYAVRITQAGASGFSATATATGTQAGDTTCRVLRLTIEGGDARHDSGPDASTTNASAENKRCWGL